MFTEAIREWAFGGSASPVSSAGSDPKSVTGSDSVPIDGDSGDEATEKTIAVPSNVASDGLTRDNHSPKEVLQAMDLKTGRFTRNFPFLALQTRKIIEKQSSSAAGVRVSRTSKESTSKHKMFLGMNVSVLLRIELGSSMPSTRLVGGGFAR